MRPEGRLTRDTVVRAALDLLNEVGMDGLSTRLLAARLGVQSPTLYWHFRNKRALLDAMAVAMLARHTHAWPPEAEADWRSWLTVNARSFRHALLAYRDGARVHAGTGPDREQIPLVEAQLRLLCGHGFAPADALSIVVALSRFVVGWVLEEQARAMDADDRGGDTMPDVGPEAPLMAAALAGILGESPDAAFDRALGYFIAGLTPAE
ncbi:TetR/AcrR family transcriptional regulator C-terminal domain-containing protein [Nitrospirillum sp. BR 11828]|uniref:TetR/AcrR family transcriptional regulator C-terminal domain-containing protein n=1 Tax=Nitrospirillum sp. BR 11828 TaxID=3104325 RepID=UPI002ACADADC|nr:TetR/AcrR family transcriptional regulator C-terminal domain-containing protein [Nitrospirillum sp. BR 11828]MDZ5647027.1 TetR/AcrR family transcriptional regulator C-terminal domain-containing protein [Nitrospirillum sp. BR 11828]